MAARCIGLQRQTFCMRKLRGQFIYGIKHSFTTLQVSQSTVYCNITYSVFELSVLIVIVYTCRQRTL